MSLFILKKAITPFLLPPGIFICFLMVFGLWALRKNFRTAVLLLGMGVLMWLASAAPVADRLMRPLESGFPIPVDPKADVIIMLGGGVYAQAPDLSGTGAPSQGTLERLVTAARLHRRMDVPVLLSGGEVFAGGASSAVLAKRFLIDLGVPAEQIIIDTKSRDTCENALFSQAICNQYGYHQPLLVTSGFHLKRSVYCFEKAGLEVTPFPSGLTTWADKQNHWHSWLPTAGALSTTSAALHEWIGLLYYRIAG